MRNTTNHKLNLIEGGDSFNYQGLNENFEKLDELLESIANFSAIPKGVIWIWSGNKSNVPPGWGLCDGTNGTPDLRGRFVIHPEDQPIGTRFVLRPSKYSGVDTMTFALAAKTTLSNVVIKYSYTSIPSGDTLRVNSRTKLILDSVSGTKATTSYTLGTIKPYASVSGSTDNWGPTFTYNRGTGNVASTVVTIEITVNGVTITSANIDQYFTVGTDIWSTDGLQYWEWESDEVAIGIGNIGGEKSHVLTTAEMPNHKHAISRYSYGTGGTGICGTATTNLMSTSPTTTSGSGSGAAHNNMPPYYALYYIMKL